MLRSFVLTPVAILLSIVAGVICNQLLNTHLTGTPGPSWFDAGCSTNAESGGANCAAVLASPYAFIPPKHPDRPDKLPHLPAALVGLVYYSVLAVWLVGVGGASPGRRWLHFLVLGFVGCGLAGSAYFTYIMFTRLDEWCPWCLASHGLNLLIAVLLLLLVPAKVRTAQPSALAGRLRAGEHREVHERVPQPPARTVLVTLLAIIFITYAHLCYTGLKTWRKKATAAAVVVKQYEDVIKRFRDDPDKLVRNWQLAETHDIYLRQDDSARTQVKEGEHAWDLVIFSDFECPACRRVAKLLEEKVQPLFAGRLRIVFKHYPLNSECNSVLHAQKEKHPERKMEEHAHACWAAAVVEAARIIGGPAAFWEAHDFLFEQQALIKQGKLSTEQAAIELGFDPPHLQRVMRAQGAAQRVWEDTNDGAALKIAATPTLFLQGRKIDSLAVTDLGFWDALADRFWVEANTPRPESTKRRLTAAPPAQGAGAADVHTKTATADSPDPPDGP